jgi:hypothetical protein
MDKAEDRAYRLRAKAKELRDLARHVKSFEIRATLLCLAEDYERLSQHAERIAPMHRNRARAFG